MLMLGIGRVDAASVPGAFGVLALLEEFLGAHFHGVVAVVDMGGDLLFELADHRGHHREGFLHLLNGAEELLGFLPTERIDFKPEHTESEAHVLGTVVMGNEATQSVVDRHQIHHRIRNLLVLGGSSFPTGSPANPTLTIAALSLWTADQLFGS